MQHYILNEKHELVPASLIEWAQWFEKFSNRLVAVSDVGLGISVSTVFLGCPLPLDDGRPQHFETMVFGGPLDQEQARYATWDEAVAGHQAMVRKVQARAGLFHVIAGGKK